MKRDFLEGLGLNDDQVTKVLSQYNKDITGFNDEREKLNSNISELKAQNSEQVTQIKKYDDQIKDLTKNAADNEDLQSQ